MGKLAVIHLSDIHVHSDEDNCLDLATKIASSCFEHARNSDECLIAISGDVAFSGGSDEYKAFKNRLLDPIANSIEIELGKKCHIAIAPGNHDCVLKPADPVREILISAVIDSPDKALERSVVENCTKVQDNFFNFINSSINPAPKNSSKLFWQQNFLVADYNIVISTLNASWMSRLPEQQGQLVFPLEQFEHELNVDSDLHLALIHHPFNWYNQPAYQKLRKHLRGACTGILTGHEHIGNSGKIDEQSTGVSLYFEAAALQPHEQGAQAGFAVHIFDMKTKQAETFDYLIVRDEVNQHEITTVQSWKEKIAGGSPELTDAFSLKLNDAGGNFSHTAKERLTLDDIYIWPDLRDWDSQDVNRQQTKSSRSILPDIIDGGHFIFYGDEKSGKTSLIYSYFRELFSQGYFPVYLTASSSSVRNETDAERKINKAIEEQYRNFSTIKNLPRAKRILFIDDIDRLKSGLHTLPQLFSYADKHFGGICLTAGSGFEVTNLTSREAIEVLAPFDSHEIMPFGLKLRHQLIKKWVQLSTVTSMIELDRRVEEVESIVNTVVGKRLVPEFPLYLLILLQSSEQHRHGEIQNSGLSFYYQYLITKSLGSVGVKPSELDEHFNYLSILAWKFKSLDQKELEYLQISDMNKEFSSRYVTVELKERLDLLSRARILSGGEDENYSFAYPYIYYFFLGRYLAKNIDAPEVRTLIEESCRKLYLRDAAHTVMFLTHHVENSWVIGLICDVLRNCFSEKNPVELNGDTTFISDLVERSSQLQLQLPTPDVEKNQNDVRELQDGILEQETDETTGDFSALSFASKWNLLHKTAEILGLILTNYYGSLERPRKQEMIREVFDGPLRALRLWLEEVASDLPALVANLKQTALEKNPRLDSIKTEIEIKRRLFNIFGFVATGTIASCGSFVGTEKLREDVSTVVEANPTNAYRLIEASARLLKPGKLPLDRVKKLSQDLEKNPYAFGVLQALAFYHMYMFHTDEPQKQALCTMLKISFSQAKSIELQKHGRTLR